VAEPRHPPLITDRIVTLDAVVGVDNLWRVIVDIAAALASDEWVLIGGQMVALHGFIAGAGPPRATTDIDIVADVLARKGTLERCASVLESMQLRPRPSITGKSLHRFVGERATVDLVVPDHLPPSAAARLRGYAAVPITGGRRALDRA
jgi:predicted nucleotidyltransferase